MSKHSGHARRRTTGKPSDPLLTCLTIILLVMICGMVYVVIVSAQYQSQNAPVTPTGVQLTFGVYQSVEDRRLTATAYASHAPP